MPRPFRKQFGFWAVLILVLAVTLPSLPPVQVEYHKWRLQSAKTRKARLLGATPSGIDKIWFRLTGNLISGIELDRAILKHEDALVRRGFLKQTKLPAQMVSACSETKEALAGLQSECPWYHTETISTNLVLTACPAMLDRWRKRARELGW